MIWDLIASIVLKFVQVIVVLIPNSSILPTAVNNAFTTLGTQLGAGNRFFPVDQLFIAINYLLLVVYALLVYKFLRWAWRKIPWLHIN